MFICSTRLSTRSTRLFIRSTRLSTRSTRLSTLSIRLFIRSTRLSTRSTRLFIRSTRLSTRSMCPIVLFVCPLVVLSVGLFTTDHFYVTTFMFQLFYDKNIMFEKKKQ